MSYIADAHTAARTATAHAVTAAAWAATVHAVMFAKRTTQRPDRNPT